MPTYFAGVFTYSGDNRSLQGLIDAVELVMETGFAVTAFMTMILNLVLPEELEDSEVEVERLREDEASGQGNESSVEKSHVGDEKLA